MLSLLTAEHWRAREQFTKHAPYCPDVCWEVTGQASDAGMRGGKKEGQTNGRGVMLAHQEEFRGTVPDGHNDAVLVKGSRRVTEHTSKPKVCPKKGSHIVCMLVNDDREKCKNKPPILT